MASSRFRHIPLYINSRKFAEANAFAYNLDSGDEVQIGSDGVLGLSDGIPMIKIESDFIQPVAGTSIDLMSLFLNKTEIQVQSAVAGKLHALRMRISNLSINSESKTGAVKGKITMQNSSDLDVV